MEGILGVAGARRGLPCSWNGAEPEPPTPVFRENGTWKGFLRGKGCQTWEEAAQGGGGGVQGRPGRVPQRSALVTRWGWLPGRTR